MHAYYEFVKYLYKQVKIKSIIQGKKCDISFCMFINIIEMYLLSFSFTHTDTQEGKKNISNYFNRLIRFRFSLCFNFYFMIIEQKKKRLWLTQYGELDPMKVYRFLNFYLFFLLGISLSANRIFYVLIVVISCVNRWATCIFIWNIENQTFLMYFFVLWRLHQITFAIVFKQNNFWNKSQ